MVKPILGVTMGDASGAGPEIVTKAWSDPAIREMSRLLVIGDARCMARAFEITGVPGEVHPVNQLGEARFEKGLLDVLDLDDIDHFTTPAVSFFLGLPGPRHPKQAFDVMVAAARKLSQELNGELKDDQRSVLTAQTIEHYRQRIVEFERRQMTIKQR